MKGDAVYVSKSSSLCGDWLVGRRFELPSGVDSGGLWEIVERLLGGCSGRLRL